MILDSYQSGGFMKGLTAARLIELLQTLPPEVWIVVNKVGNLSLCDTDKEYIGHIDMLAEGEIKMNETEGTT